MSFTDLWSPVAPAIASGTFDPTGANYTSGNGVAFNDAIPFPRADPRKLGLSTPLAASDTPVGGAVPVVSAVNNANAATAANTNPSVLSGWFVRIVIVILGMAFVAAGLFQLRSPIVALVRK